MVGSVAYVSPIGFNGAHATLMCGLVEVIRKDEFFNEYGTKTRDDQSMRIWDLHCHLSGIVGATPEERAGKLIAIADRMGIERLCVYMGLKVVPGSIARNVSPRKTTRFFKPLRSFLIGSLVSCISIPGTWMPRSPNSSVALPTDRWWV